ncbi:galactokinase [Stackebrandtia nassauensis]|uniref:Galactokinase n=1 Tax=Stackebrandtia nassauensis (strain DSM 44728 / CIP 108903 / NRRL B-16338 / NBRC 102104 / LLR-40K-21) TaxID=446470 RepID=D3Q8Z4_STANL|nr:galactokinase [Stackebrandtia nassauensis]ADD40603.1 galactokinase [Stackebrandtia nassauensis DSM 44728]
MDDLVKRAREVFRLRFGGDPDAVWAAPGRINLLGEHTDYNDGFVLPHAIPYYTVAAVSKAGSPTWRVHSDGIPQTSTFGLGRVGGKDRPADAVTDWSAYVAGIVWSLREHEAVEIGGARIAIVSDVPVGAGVSSSAALEMAVLGALCDIYEVDLEPRRAVLAAQRAENEYVGVPTGILDQTASLMSRENHALFMDCRTQSIEELPFDLEGTGYRMLLIDSRAPHRHVDNEYADRRRDCERAAALLGVESLRDVGDHSYFDLPDLVLRRRVRHIVTENHRVRDAAEVLRAGAEDIPLLLGYLFNESHQSMMVDYEITVPEIDHLVAAALRAGAVGARMTGGGFGGSVIAIVGEDDAEAVCDAIATSAVERDFPEPVFRTCYPAPGAYRIDIT